MSINPAIFKAYDVRGLYPQEINEEAARLIGRGFVSYLGAKRIAVSRDMRLSSPSLAQAWVYWPMSERKVRSRTPAKPPVRAEGPMSIR